MSEHGPIILGLDTEWASLAQCARRAPGTQTVCGGIPVTGMVNGEVRKTYPSEPFALELLKDESTSKQRSTRRLERRQARSRGLC